MDDDDEFGPVLNLEEENSVGDTIEVTERDGHFNITVDEPWAGCTETGFGQTTSVSLKRHQAELLHAWLGARLRLLDNA